MLFNKLGLHTYIHKYMYVHDLLYSNWKYIFSQFLKFNFNFECISSINADSYFALDFIAYLMVLCFQMNIVMSRCVFHLFSKPQIGRLIVAMFGWHLSRT